MQNTYSLQALKNMLESLGLFQKGDINKQIEQAMSVREVREFFDLEQPQISDFTEMLEIIGSGKVYAIRMDLNSGVDNHKKFVVASLILRGVLDGRLPDSKVDTLIDAGNFNSAKALRFYCERFGMKGCYVMSKLFPENVLALLRTNNFSIIQAPDVYEDRREVEFYGHLFALMKNSDFRKNKHCLWHPKHGGESTTWLGKILLPRIPERLNVFISCLGAGSTLEGIQIPIKEVTGCQIMISEHEKSQLFGKIKPSANYATSTAGSILGNFKSYEGLPHMVIGPHFDEINPLLSKTAIQMIDSVMFYGEGDWQTMETYLKEKGISVGNSSAANIYCAKRLANEGRVVLTIIFEPQRSFYVTEQ